MLSIMVITSLVLGKVKLILIRNEHYWGEIIIESRNHYVMAMDNAYLIKGYRYVHTDW